MTLSLKGKVQNSKFLITILFIVIFLFPLFLVNGQTPATSSPRVRGMAEDKEIKTFKEKIATKVAQLQKKNNKAISGYVTEVNEGYLKIKTDDEQVYEIKIDQMLTKYYQIKGNQQIEIKFSDIKKDDYIIVSGIENDKRVDANFIFIDEAFAVLSGKVIEVDRENYTLKVTTTDGDNYSLDIEVTTKQQMINVKTLQIEKTGFSKIKEGDTIHFVIKRTSSLNKENKYSAQKILIIPQEYFIK